ACSEERIVSGTPCDQMETRGLPPWTVEAAFTACEQPGPSGGHTGGEAVARRPRNEKPKPWGRPCAACLSSRRKDIVRHTGVISQGWPLHELRELWGTVRTATCSELATLYATLSRRRLLSNTAAPTIVFVSCQWDVGRRHGKLAGCTGQSPALAAGVELLAKFGVQIASLTVGDLDDAL